MFGELRHYEPGKFHPCYVEPGEDSCVNHRGYEGRCAYNQLDQKGMCPTAKKWIEAQVVAARITGQLRFYASPSGNGIEGRVGGQSWQVIAGKGYRRENGSFIEVK